MPRQLIIVGPPLPDDDGPLWCAVCVARWKAALVAALGIDAAWVKHELAGNETDPPKVIAAPRGHTMPSLEFGVTMQPVGAVGGTALVCWTHADALGTVPVVAPGDGQQRLIPGLS
jgi:hypothetical protein